MEFVLTSDLDWASEFCIEHFLEITRRFAVKPTVFVTHRSAAIDRALRAGEIEAGIHPNFVSGSDHGEAVADVVDAVMQHVARPVASRSHRFIDSAEIQAALTARGIAVDSNVCCHLERDLAPRLLRSGIRRYPVFFEDDIHWTGGGTWNFETYADAFFSPALKVLNFHPFFVALNIPDAEVYMRCKPSIRSLSEADAAALRHRGQGAGTFLNDMLEAILAAGHRFVSLTELDRASSSHNVAPAARVPMTTP